MTILIIILPFQINIPEINPSEVEIYEKHFLYGVKNLSLRVNELAEDLNLKVLDATCPLVSKVHKEAEKLYKNNYHILLIGHFNHPEVIGTMGQLPKNSIDLIERVEDADKYVNFQE